MRLIATIAAAVCAVAAHAAHIAPWNPDVAAGLAIALHGLDVATTGFNVMVSGVQQDTLTVQALQSVGVTHDNAMGVDAGISMGATMGMGMAIRAAGISLQSMNDSTSRAALTDKGTAVQKYYPLNEGAIGDKSPTYLYKGTIIDRYGGSSGSVYFSPAGTPVEMRSLPPSSMGDRLRTFMVEKPFQVEQSVVAPAFNQIGGGIQYRAPVGLGVLLQRGILREIR